MTDICGSEVKVESSLDNAPVSMLFQNATVYATELERRYPLWSKDRIFATILEQGDFGDLRILLQSPSGSAKSPSSSPIVVQSKPPPPMTAEYPARYLSQHYPGPEMPQVPAYAGTINPATLTVHDPFSYTEALNGEESSHATFASDTTRSADFEEPGAPYYDMQPPFVLYHPQMRYGGEQHDMGYPVYR